MSVTFNVFNALNDAKYVKACVDKLSKNYKN